MNDLFRENYRFVLGKCFGYFAALQTIKHYNKITAPNADINLINR